jgi:hypothetical protein
MKEHIHDLEELWTDGTYYFVRCKDPKCDYQDHLIKAMEANSKNV